MRLGLLLGGLLLAAPLRFAVAQEPVQLDSLASGRASYDTAQIPAATGVHAVGRDLGAGLLGTAYTVTRPLRWSGRQWLVLPAAAGGLALLSGLDEPVHRLVDRNRTPGLDHALTSVEPLGAQYAIGLVLATYGIGVATNRPGIRRLGVEAATSGLVAAGMVTPGLKLLVGRARPRQGRGAYDFHALSGDESFPSGHTTQAFAVASVFAAEARPLALKVTAYGLAGAVASARLVHDAHFLSDVVAGAAIGTLTGRAAVRWEREHPGSWRPYIGREGVGVSRSF